jgi:hypothetical protein
LLLIVCCSACDLLIEWRWTNKLYNLKKKKKKKNQTNKRTKQNKKTAAQTREARDWGCSEHRPPRRGLGGCAQASLRPCKLSLFFNDVRCCCCHCSCRDRSLTGKSLKTTNPLWRHCLSSFLMTKKRKILFYPPILGPPIFLFFLFLFLEDKEKFNPSPPNPPLQSGAQHIYI